MSEHVLTVLKAWASLHDNSCKSAWSSEADRVAAQLDWLRKHRFDDSQVRLIKSKDKSARTRLLDDLGITEVENLISEISAPEWLVSTIAKYQTPADDLNYLFSLIIEDCNFVCLDKGNLRLYIVQYIGCIALYVPSANSMISINSIDGWSLWALTFVNKLITFVAENFVDFHDAKPVPMREVLLSMKRPYHYYYDTLHGLEKLLNSSTSLTKLSLTHVSNNAFFDVTPFTRDRFGRVSTSAWGDHNRDALRRGHVAFLLTYQFAHKREMELIESLDTKLLEIVSKDIQSEQSTINTNLPLIWIGICTEKRLWLNQEDDIPFILNSLHNDFGAFQVVLDGRTYPLSPGPSDLYHRNLDNKVVTAIAERLDAGITVINSCGYTGFQKLSLARKVSFFLTSYFTDSIYVSRMCRKPGIALLQNDLIDSRHLHVHWKAVEINSTWVSSEKRNFCHPDAAYSREEILEHARSLMRASLGTR
jgi:hypothetical protein